MSANIAGLTAKYGFDVSKVDSETIKKISTLPDLDKTIIATTLILHNYSLYFTAGKPDKFFAFPLDIAVQVQHNVEQRGCLVKLTYDHDHGGVTLPWPVGALVHLKNANS